ncbi:MAG: NAD-dependent epimerase/dehydratase family protein [Syntrophomonadaceae bacterium]
MKRVIITGATGVVGVALTEYCIHNDVKVTAVVRPDSENLYRLPEDNTLDIIECDLNNIDRLPSLLDGKFDVFYHLGWAAKGRYNRNNAVLQAYDIRHTLASVKAAKEIGCEAFIGAGSQAEYGRVNHAIEANMPTNPDNAYGVAKYAAGKLSSILCQDFGIRHIWARIFSVYGPWDNRDTMIMYAVERLMESQKPLFTKCEQIWDYLYTTDAARALFLLGLKGVNGTTYNIGSGKALPLIDYIEIIREKVNPAIEIGVGVKAYSEKEVMHLCADITNLTADTGFTPEISFEDGIRKTIEWFRFNNSVNHIPK